MIVCVGAEIAGVFVLLEINSVVVSRRLAMLSLFGKYVAQNTTGNRFHRADYRSACDLEQTRGIP